MVLSACTNSNVKPREINSEHLPNVLFILTDNQAARIKKEGRWPSLMQKYKIVPMRLTHSNQSGQRS